MTAVAIRRVQAKGLVEKTFDAAMVRLRLPLRTTVASLISIKQAPSTVVMLGISASYLSEVPIRLRTMATYLYPANHNQQVITRNKYISNELHPFILN
jgi:hypothetical protein